MIAHGDYIVHFPRGTSWASLLLRAQSAGRIDRAQMWEILLAHAEDLTEPDIGTLLMHLPWPGEQPLPPVVRPPTDDWFVVDEGAGAA